MTGARNLSAAGSPIAAAIWGVIYMLGIAVYNGFGDDPWDDEKEIERYISYHIRQIPGVGVGENAIYDMTALTLALIAEQEEITKSKLQSVGNYIMPVGFVKEAGQLGKAIATPMLEAVTD